MTSDHAQAARGESLEDPAPGESLEDPAGGESLDAAAAEEVLTGKVVAAATDTPMLQASGASVAFPVGGLPGHRRFLHAVDVVDLSVGRGASLGIVGESGSGKSTLARALAGLQPLTGGEIMFEGRRMPDRRSRDDQRRIQMVFQDPYSSLNPRLTVGGTLRELLRVHHVVPRSGVEAESEALITRVGLTPEALHAYPRQFSGGQRQRVAIARALALRPDVLVADEPVSALDVSVQATILNLLSDLRTSLGLTMVLISHNLSVVRHLCDTVAVMYLGRIVESGPAARLLDAPAHPYTKGLLAAIPRLPTPGDADPGHILDTPPALQGDPPSPLNIPAGCRFRSRCPMAQAICETDDPALRADPADPARQAACHFAFAGNRRRECAAALAARPGAVSLTSHSGGTCQGRHGCRYRHGN